MTSDLSVPRARYEREKAARQSAEQLLETKSRDLFLANRRLEEQARILAALVDERTLELKLALEDVQTSLKAAQETKILLAESERKFRSIVEAANDIVYILNLDGTFDYVSPRLEASLGHSSTALVGQHFSMVIHPLDIEGIEACFDKVAAERQPLSGLEFRICHVDGCWHWHDNNVAPIVDVKDELKGLLGIGRNIEARKHTESKLYHLAHTDNLTGIANRYAIIEQLKRELLKARSAQRKLAVMFIDLDGFKLINDNFGHDAGDTILQHFASSLKVATRGGSDYVGRLAGDEFLVILPDLPDSKTAEHAARRIQNLLKVPLVVDGTQIVVGFSVGVAVFPEDGDDLDKLISTADTAMYLHKTEKQRSL